MADLILQSLDLIIFLSLVILGYISGSMAEKKHYRSIIQREKELLKLPVLTAEGSFRAGLVKESVLVTGSAVISIDYFKRLMAVLRNLFGGRVKAYESLLDRARREAILRMKAEAKSRGAAIVVNMRLETAAIGKNADRKRQLGSVEAVAYGTAVIYNPR